MNKFVAYFPVALFLLVWACCPSAGLCGQERVSNGELRFVTPDGQALYPYTIVTGTHLGASTAFRETKSLRKRGHPAATTHDHATNRAGQNKSWTVQVSACKDKASADSEVARLKKKGHDAFNALYHVAGKGDWYRVLTGLYGTRREAQLAAKRLGGTFKYARALEVDREYFEICVGFFKTREEASDAASKWKKVFPLADIRKKPYAVQAGVSDSEAELADMENELAQKGYLPYRVPDRKNRYATRLLIGAFELGKSAEHLRRRLERQGFESKTVLR